MEHLSGTFLVHNGKEQKKVKVSSKMVGHKFGEFSFTRTKPRGGRSTAEEESPWRRRSSPVLASWGLRAECGCTHARVHLGMHYSPSSEALGCAARLGGRVGWEGRVAVLGALGARPQVAIRGGHR